MAQPVFDGHPLEEYLQDSGEAPELMPGGIPDIPFHSSLPGHPSIPKHAETMEKVCYLIFGAAESLSSFFHSNHRSIRTQAFAERFKYGIISSSLLSPACPASPMTESHRRGSSLSLPGHLPNGHSRSPSGAESMVTDLSLSMPPEPEAPIWPLTLSLTVAIAAFSARFYFFGLLLFAATLYYMHAHRLDIHSKPDIMTPSLLALQHLIAAGQLWGSVVNDTFTMLENEERRLFYGPPSPLTPSSSLRVALSTSLLTTQTQCDNVRQLLSAITSPSELAQLSEMYAPPSPIQSAFPRTSDSHRPLSHPGPSTCNTSSTDRSRKRSTWNGSYASLALAGSPPPFQLVQRREKRRSDLSAFLCNASPSPARIQSRNTRSSSPQLLADVSEEEDDDDGMATAESSSLVGIEAESSFGAAALGLHRTRVQDGLRTLELPQHCTPLSLSRGSSMKRRTTMSPGSKYTSMRATRHPFSLSSLHQSLQSALASKRFACSHLLALRFEDDEDEVYWEDVRSVMSLLTSTLVDASSRLSEVLDEVEEQHLKVEDTTSGLSTPSSLASPPPVRTHLPLSPAKGPVASYAPLPSHFARFASHVDAISSALDDAREQLDQCVASLKMTHTPGHSSHPSFSSSADSPPSSQRANAGPGAGEPSEHPAIQAYERLRRELGLALRECERGRERLVNIVTPPTPSTTEDEPQPADDDPTAGATSDDGAPLSLKNADADHDRHDADDDDDVRGAPVPGEEHEDVVCADDATPHLLRGTSAAHLPPPGIEQVFEADAGTPVGLFTRARSTLSRAERILLARAKRAHGSSGSGRGGVQVPLLTDEDDVADVPAGRHAAQWGPGGEVVQELKDVIWKVGERRRKMAEGT